jgi:hypothetical protein
MKSKSKIILGSIMLIIGIIVLSASLGGWSYYGPIGGLLWGGGLIFIAMIGWTTIGAILIIIGLILVITGLIMRRKKSQ